MSRNSPSSSRTPLAVVGILAGVLLLGLVLWRTRPGGGPGTLPIRTNDPAGSPNVQTKGAASTPTPTAPPPVQEGFVSFEPGFEVRKDCVPRVTQARLDVEKARARVAAVAQELVALAGRHKIELRRGMVVHSIQQARETVAAGSPQDAERLDALLLELADWERFRPADYPLTGFTPPGTLLALLTTLETGQNPVEKEFWREYLKRELKLDSGGTMDDGEPQRPAVHRRYSPMLIAHLETWMARGDALALEMMGACLTTQVPDYEGVVSRIGQQLVKTLTGASSGEFVREAVSFLQARATPEVRSVLMDEFRRSQDPGAAMRLASAMPVELNAEESALLLGACASTPGVLAILSDRLQSVATCGRSNPQVAAALEDLDRTVGRKDSRISSGDAALYCVRRLQGLDGPARAVVEESLVQVAASTTTPRERSQLASTVTSLKSPVAVSILATLSADADPTVSRAGGLGLVELLFRERLPAADGALAKALENPAAPALKDLLTRMTTQSPPAAPHTQAALERLAKEAPSEVIRILADQVARAIARIRK